MVENILKENEKRNKDNNKKYNPITGEGCLFERKRLVLTDYAIPEMFLPVEMFEIPLIKGLMKYKSIEKYIIQVLKCDYSEEIRESVNRQIIRIRSLYDFEFWAFFFVFISNKYGGSDINFKLWRPQWKLLNALEQMRKSAKPIRIVLLKARQWGGSTLVQIYIVWLQLVHMDNWGSVIAAQTLDQSKVIKGMYRKMLEKYPPWMLYLRDEDGVLDLSPFESSTHHFKVSQKGKFVRNSIIGIGTAEKPDTLRGMPAACAHYSEVGVWKKTDGKTPEDIVTSVASGILSLPNTIQVMESTAKGQGTYFHQEWIAACSGTSGWKPVFVAWWEIPTYEVPLTLDEKRQLATWILSNRTNKNTENARSESGSYYWKLWNLGATLEAIAWYKRERGNKSCHANMASEFPSDADEAFTNSGNKVFENTDIEKLRKYCKSPKMQGELVADSDNKKKNFTNIRFQHTESGCLKVWDEPDTEERISNRYLVIVDVGGRSKTADFSHIWVIDRYDTMEGGVPKTVADWHGHIDHDKLAWLACRIAYWYDNALLVFESNTYETKDQDTDGDQTEYILSLVADYYDNLYSRTTEIDIVEKVPIRYGFHTNRSTKPMIISNLVAIVRDTAYLERNNDACDEYGWYEKKENGSFGAIIGKHDDILMTRAIGLHISYNEMDIPKRIKIQSNKRSSGPLNEARI